MLLGLTINLSAQNLPFVNVNFNSSGNLTLCSSHLTGTINYGNLPIGTSISFVFPNTMFLENNSNATIQAIPPDGLFYTWTFITDGTGSIPFSMIPTNVNNYLIGGPIYSNNVMQFDASFILNGEEASATLSGNGTFNPDNSGLIEYSLNNNPITLSVTPANQQFNNIGDVGYRAFSVVLNSSEIQSFIWNYVPETDITISSGAPQNGVITNAGSFSFTESFTMSDCSPSAGFATASITCPDGSLISSNVNLNASINIVPPTFSVASLNINRPENLPDGCDQTYELIYQFNISPNQEIELHTLNIPINTNLYPISSVLINEIPIQFDEVPIGTNFILNTPVSVTNGFEVKVITSLNYLQFQSCAQVSNILHSSNQVSLTYKRVCSDELFSANFNLPNNLPDGAEFLGTLIGGAQEIDYSNENPTIDMYYEFLTTTGVQFGLEAPNECGIQYRAVITAEDQNGATVTLSRDAGDTEFLQELSINMGPVFIENYYDLIFQLTFGFCPYDNIDPFSGNVFVEIEIQAYCVECESSFRTLRCLRQTIQAHCIGPCTSEVGTLNEELTPKPNIKRITLGWDDIESYNEGEAPKTSLDLSGTAEKQQLRTFYPYDIFEVTAYGHIDAGVGLIGFEIAYPEMIGINFEFIKGVVCAPGDEELLNTNFTIEESLGPIFGYTDPLLRYRVYAGAPNSEIVKFRGLYRVRSENLSVAILENEFRLQFVTTEFESCDSYGMRLTFLKPNTDFKVEVMPISTSSVISELYTRNTPLSLYSFEIENKNKDLCRTSVAVIASAYGAKGGVVADFPFETRPMIDWPANIQFNEVVKAIYLPEDTYSNDISQNLNLIPNGTDTDVFLVNPTDLQKPILPPILPSNTQENVKGVYLEFMGDCSDEEIIQIVSTNFKFYDHAYVNHLSFLLNDVLDPLNLPPVFDPPTNTIDFETLPFEELGPIAGELNYNLSTLLSTPTYALNGNIYDLPISILPPTAITIDGNSVVPELENLLLYYYLTNADGTEISNNSTLGPIAEYSDNLIAPAVFNPTGYTYYFDDIIQFNGANLLGNIPVDLDCPNQTYKLTIKLIHFCKEDDFNNFQNGEEAACETYTKILNLSPALPTQIVTNSAELELVTDVSSGECYLQLTATFVNPIGKPEILQPQFFFNTPGGLILESTNSILNYEGSSEPITSTGLTFESMAAPFNSNASATFGLYPSDPDFVFEAGTQMEFIVRFRFSTTLCDLANASGISNFSILGKLKGKGRCAADGSLAANLSAFSKQLGSSVPSLQQNSICCENAPITVTTINACLGENGSLIITPNPSYTSQINYTLYSQNDAPYAGIVDLTLPISLPIGVYGLLITLDDGLQMAYTINIRSGEISPNLVTTTSIVCESTPYTATMSDGNLYNAGHTYTYSWFNQSNPSNVLSTSNPFVYNSPVQGTYQVVITDWVTGCTATHVFNIQVDDQPTTANAGADQTICLGTNATLTANALTVGTGTWSTTATGINIMNPYSNVTDVSGLTAPSYTFTYTTSNGVCPPSIDQLTVAVQNPPLANAGPPQTICTSSTTLDANNSQYGTWTLVSGNGTIDTPASNTSDVTGLSLGTNTFRWTVNNSICPAVSSDVVITVEALPPATITASGTLNFCEGGSVNLTAPAGNSYTWTRDGISFGGTTNQITATLGGVYQVTVTNSSNCTSTDSRTVTVNPKPIITPASLIALCQGESITLNASGGSNSNYTWSNGSTSISTVVSTAGNYTVTDGVCTSIGTAVTVDAPPSLAIVGTYSNICEGSALSLAANTPTVGQGTWSISPSGASFSDPNSPTATVTNLTPETYSLTWTIANGVCDPSLSTVSNVQVIAPPTVNAGTDQTICSSNATLDANNSQFGTWTLVSGNGTIDTPASNTSTVSDLSEGINTFLWTVNNSTCPADNDDVVITVVEAPLLSMPIPSEMCNEQSFDLEISPIGGQLSYNGNSITVTSDPITISGAELPLGNNDFSYDYTYAPGCIASTIGHFQVVSECLCLCPNPLQVPVVVPNQVSTGDELVAFYGESIENRCIQINNNITFSNTFTFQDCNITFAPGVELSVVEGGYLKIFNSELHGCEAMWKGIRSAGKLNLASSLIRDAQYGVTLVQLDNFTPYSKIVDTKFKNNFIGITNDRSIGSTHILTLNGCRFSGGGLIPNYSGQHPTAHSNGGLAGIKVFGYDMTVSETNSFEKLMNGILASKSMIHVEAAKFSEIRAVYGSSIYSGLDYFYAPNFNKTAAINIQMNCVASVTGYAWNDLAEPEFTACDYGICCYKSVIDVSSCKIGSFDNPGQAIRRTAILVEEANQNYGFNLSGNKIRSGITGIEIRLSSGLSRFSQIKGNNISMRNVHSIGLKVYNNNDGQNIWVVNNTINLISNLNPWLETIGMHISGANGISITDNKIRRKEVSRGKGIRMENSEGAYVFCNHVLGWDEPGEPEHNNQMSDRDNFGFYFINSPNATITNNLSEHTRVGFQFVASNLGISFKENTMNKHGNATNTGAGLLLGFNTDITTYSNEQETTPVLIGNHTDARNQWLNMNNAIGAKKPLGGGNSQLNGFFVNNQFSGLINDFYPTHSPEDQFDCLNDPFFVCGPGDTDPLDYVCAYNGSPLQGYRIANPENVADVLNAFLADSISFISFNDEMLYQIQKDLDAMLFDSLLQMPDTGRIALLNQLLVESNTRELNKISSLAGKFKADSTVALNLKSLVSQIDSLHTLIANLNELLILDTLNQESILAQITSHTDQITPLKEEMEAIKATFTEQRTIKFTESELRNTAVIAENFIEQLEKQVNSLFKAYMVEEFAGFNVSQQNQLDSIASICPLLGGNSVFKARSLQSTYNDSIYYDDKLLCNQQGVYYRLAAKDTIVSKKEEKLILFPNPTSDKLTVFLQSEIKEDYSIEIFNLMGQQVFEKKKCSNTISISFDSFNLSSGTYIVALKQSITGKVFRERFQLTNQ